MTVPQRALVIFGVLMTACALLPVKASPLGVPLLTARSLTAQSQGDAAGDSGAAVPSERDIKTVLRAIKDAWRDYAPCEPHKTCDVYFESYGVALTFNDGTIVPFAHVQRLAASGRDCIVNARAALDRGDRGLAVQWVMASYPHDDAFRAWLGDHPDTVVAALQRCCERGS
jgi:hypothetical protein